MTSPEQARPLPEVHLGDLAWLAHEEEQQRMANRARAGAREIDNARQLDSFVYAHVLSPFAQPMAEPGFTEVTVGTRGHSTWPVAKSAWGPAVSWDTEWGGGNVNGLVYNVDAMAGVGAVYPRIRVSLMAGLGASQAGERIPYGTQLPVAFNLAFEDSDGGVLFWAQPTWVFSSAQRQHGTSTEILSADELSGGLGIVFSRTSWGRVLVAASYREAMNSQFLGFLVGLSTR